MTLFRGWKEKLLHGRNICQPYVVGWIVSAPPPPATQIPVYLEGQNVAFFGNRDFANIISKEFWSEITPNLRGPKFNGWRGRFWTKRYKQKMIMLRWRQKLEVHNSRKPGMTRSWKSQAKILSRNLQRVHSADTLILHFCPQELWENKFLLF